MDYGKLVSRAWDIVWKHKIPDHFGCIGRLRQCKWGWQCWSAGYVGHGTGMGDAAEAVF